MILEALDELKSRIEDAENGRPVVVKVEMGDYEWIEWADGSHVLPDSMVAVIVMARDRVMTEHITREAWAMNPTLIVDTLVNLWEITDWRK